MLKLLIFIILVNGVLISQIDTKIDSLLNLIEKAGKNDDVKKETGEIIESLYINDYKIAYELHKRILWRAEQFENKFLYINALVHSHRFYGFNEKLNMLNKAELLASIEKNDELLASVYQFKAISFRDNSNYDSAMTYALFSKEILEKNRSYDLIAVIQLIADMHYYAGEYEEAEKLYLRIQKEELNHSKNFNYRIINNNLGLIKLKTGFPEEAEKLFLLSLEHISKIAALNSDSSGMPYIYRKLTEAALLQGDFDKAGKYCEQGIQYSLKFSQFIELPGLYISKGKVFYETGKNDSTLFYFNLAEKLEKEYPNVHNKANLYESFAKFYQKTGNYQEASKYLNLLISTIITIDSLQNRAKLLHLYAQHNYNSTVRELERSIFIRNLFLIIVIIVVVSIIVILVYYGKLRKSHKILVEKSLQMVYQTEPLSFTKMTEENEQKLKIYYFNSDGDEEPEKKQKEVDESILNQLSSKLESILFEQKAYLDPNLTGIGLAEKINSNRTYLQKAVRKKYNMNIPDLLNELRVKESIRIINSGEHKNLSVDGIAVQAGFNNRVTFGKAFKEFTGVSPSVFIKELDSLQVSKTKKA